MGNFTSSVEYKCDLCDCKFEDLLKLYEHYSNGCEFMINQNTNNEDFQKLIKTTKHLAELLLLELLNKGNQIKIYS